jgi:hypothetical protein
MPCLVWLSIRVSAWFPAAVFAANPSVVAAMWNRSRSSASGLVLASRELAVRLRSG